MFERRDVEFCAEGGLKLRGWLFVPEKTSGPRPAVTMAHGYAGVKEHGLERFARAFAEAGFVVLLHDHRNFGASDGAERGDVDPWQQIADWRRAISFLENQPEVDAYVDAYTAELERQEVLYSDSPVARKMRRLQELPDVTRIDGNMLMSLRVAPVGPMA